MNERQGALPFLAFSEYELATVLLRRSSRGDRAEALTLLARARDRAAALHMEGLLTDTSAALQRARRGSSPHRATHRTRSGSCRAGCWWPYQQGDLAAAAPLYADGRESRREHLQQARLQFPGAGSGVGRGARSVRNDRSRIVTAGGNDRRWCSPRFGGGSHHSGRAVGLRRASSPSRTVQSRGSRRTSNYADFQSRARGFNEFARLLIATGEPDGDEDGGTTWRPSIRGPGCQQNHSD